MFGFHGKKQGHRGWPRFARHNRVPALVLALTLMVALATGCGPGSGSQGPPPPPPSPDAAIPSSGGSPTGTSGSPGSATGAATGTNPSAQSTFGSAEITPGPITEPDAAKSLTVNANISFSDGTQPVPYPEANDPNIMIFKNLQVVVDLSREVSIEPGIVRKEGAYVFGAVVPVQNSPTSYRELTSITFSAPGYKDVTRRNVPVEKGFVQLKPVVMVKK